jgi:prolycopene isomerase
VSGLRDEQVGERWDAIVIGAGYGGAVCAALLARAGWRVLLLDKNARAGGKALGVTRAGSTYEMWPIAGGPARGSRFEELSDLLGLRASKLLCPERVCEFIHLDQEGLAKSFVVPARPVRDPREIARLMGELGVPARRLGGLALLSLGTVALPERALGRLDRVPILDVLRRLRLPQRLESYLCALLNILFVVPVDRLPASEALRTLRQFHRGGAGRYHAGGYGSLAVQAAEYVARHGGRFVPSTRVERLIVEHGAVVGARTARGEHRAPVVVSSAGIQPTVLRLAGAEHFPEAYVERVRRLEPSWALAGVRYRLKKPVFRHPMTLVFSDESWLDSARFERARRGDWPRDPLVFITVPALWDPELVRAPVEQVALVGTIAPAGLGDPMELEAVLRAERTVKRLWPELEANLLGAERYGTRQVSRLTRDAVLPGQGGECIGLGQLVGQCGRDKPEPRTPLPGLWLVGCDAGGFGCGTHQAVESGFAVAEAILARGGAPTH